MVAWRVATGAILIVGVATLAGCTQDPAPAERGAPQSPASDPTALPSKNEPNAAGFLPAEDCSPYRPRELPDRAVAGAARAYSIDNTAVQAEAWGEGRNLVVVTRGREVLDDAGVEREAGFVRESYPGPVVAGGKRAVIWVGDPPGGTVQIRFVEDRCPYIVFLNATPVAERGDTYRGFTAEEVEEYASRL
jgi:hypothetical protein